MVTMDLNKCLLPIFRLPLPPPVSLTLCSHITTPPLPTQCVESKISLLQGKVVHGDGASSEGRIWPSGPASGSRGSIAMATSSSRGNREVPKVEQIGKGPPECQLGLSAGRAGEGR